MRKADPGSEVGVAAERFEELFRSHHAALVAYVRRRAPSDVVDDVVAETFLVAWRRLDRIPQNELPWLLSVARNVLATHRRGASRREALKWRLSCAGVERGRMEAVDGIDGRVAAALAKLAAKDCEALTLVAWEGLEPHEAAVVLGEAAGTFRVRLHRARGRLRRLLEEPSELAQRASDRRPRVGQETVHD